MQVIAYIIYICAFYCALLLLVCLFCLSLKRANLAFANDFSLLASFNQENLCTYNIYISVLSIDVCEIGLPILSLTKKGTVGTWIWLWLLCFISWRMYIYACNRQTSVHLAFLSCLSGKRTELVVGNDYGLYVSLEMTITCRFHSYTVYISMLSTDLCALGLLFCPSQKLEKLEFGNDLAGLYETLNQAHALVHT